MAEVTGRPGPRTGLVPDVAPADVWLTTIAYAERAGWRLDWQKLGKLEKWRQQTDRAPYSGATDAAGRFLAQVDEPGSLREIARRAAVYLTGWQAPAGMEYVVNDTGLYLLPVGAPAERATPEAWPGYRCTATMRPGAATPSGAPGAGPVPVEGDAASSTCSPAPGRAA